MFQSAALYTLEAVTISMYEQTKARRCMECSESSGLNKHCTLFKGQEYQLFLKISYRIIKNLIEMEAYIIILIA